MLCIFRRLTLAIWHGPRILLARYRNAAALWRSRAALRDLDDYQLADIGVTRAAAEREAETPFWQDTAPWAKDVPLLHGEPYLAGRPAAAMRSFYRERQRRALPKRI